MAEEILNVNSEVQAPKATLEDLQDSDDDIEDQDFVPSEVSSCSTDELEMIPTKINQTTTKPGRIGQKVNMVADGSDSDVTILSLPEPKVTKKIKPRGLSKQNDPHWINVFKQFPDQFVDHVLKNKLGKSNSK